jgi:hypothetical protein
MLPLGANSSIATKRGVFILRTESIIWDDKSSELAAWACEQAVEERRRVVFIVTATALSAEPTSCLATERSKFGECVI